MNILITGAFGFIGRRLASALSQKSYALWLCGRSSHSFTKLAATHNIFIGNLSPSLLDQIANVSFDWIINCCGTSSVYGSTIRPHVDFESNVSSASLLVDFLIRQQDNVRFIQFSSAAIYGDHSVDKLTLSTIPNPISPYALHNLMSENILRYHYQSGNIRSLHILRLFSIYGDSLRKRLIWDACCKLHNSQTDNQVYFYGTGNEKRDWTHVEDVCLLVNRILEQDNDTFSCYNVGTGIATTNKYLISSISSLLHSNVIYKFNSFVPNYDPFSLVASVTDNPIQISPERSLSAGLADYVQWFLYHKMQ